MKESLLFGTTQRFITKTSRTLFYRELRLAGSIVPFSEALSGSFQCFDTGCQTTLMAGCFVFMDQSTGAETVEDGLGNSESRLSTVGIPDFECLDDFLDSGAQHRTLRRVACVTHNSLLGALFGGFDIGHGGAFLEIH